MAVQKMGERALSRSGTPPAGRLAPRRSRRAARFGAFAGTALLLHAALLGGVRWSWPAPAEGPSPTRGVQVRTIAAPGPGSAAGESSEAAADPAGAVPAVDVPRSAAAPGVGAVTAPAMATAKVTTTATAKATVTATATAMRAGTGTNAETAAAAAQARTAAGSATRSSAQPVRGARPTPIAEPRPEATATGAPTSEDGAEPAAPDAGDPTPLYRTRIPPAATLRFAVTRGSARGEATLRWQPADAGYALALETAVDGGPAASQTSDGSFDVAGLAPLRYLDRRTRRAALATNFGRDTGRVGFSGTGAQLPLVAGVQDRVSWIVQLAAVVAAEGPSPCADGAGIRLPVVGLRGEADVWAFRCSPADRAASADASDGWMRLVRTGRMPYDLDIEVWLDPARHHLPVRLAWRNGALGTPLEMRLTGYVEDP